MAGRDPAGERQRARDRQYQLREAETQRRARAGTARWSHPDYHGESTRDRAERLRQPVSAGSLRQLDEPEDGLTRLSLPRYTR